MPRFFGIRRSRAAGESRQSSRHVDRRSTRLSAEPLESRLVLAALPTGFTETLITTASTLSSPTAMEISPVSEIWVIEQGGNVKLVRTDGTTHTASTLSVQNTGERGLLGIAFDPTYDGKGPNTDYVYFYYTTLNNPHNRLSRFTVTGAGTTTPALGSELVLRNLPPETEDGDTNHNGGAIHFGPDGKLYVAVGDHNYDPAAQTDHPSQRLDTPFGKILRLNPDGSNPGDNPFDDDNAQSWAGAIWAMGLRNPYTFAFNPANGQMFINDVGESAWEEINLGEAGANYGWAGNNGPRWEGFEAVAPPWTNYRDPIMAYDQADNTPPTLPGGVAITGGVFYPAGSQFGAAYADKYFFADYGANFVRVFDAANPGSLATPDTSTDFVDSPGSGAPVDLKIDAQGSLYYLTRGAGGEVYRVTADSPTTVLARQVFYNQSVFDGGNAGINVSDDAAIATDKSAYLAGSGTATFANFSSYTRGINGVMIDIGETHGPISAADFQFKVGNSNTPASWANGPAPASVVVRPNAGLNGSDRIEITWGANAPKNTWLQVTVKGNDSQGGFNTNSGLASSDIFYFGSRIGDSGSGTPVSAVTNLADELAVRNNTGAGATVTNLYDYDRNGQVQLADANSTRGNTGTTLKINLASPPERSAIGGEPIAVGLAAQATGRSSVRDESWTGSHREIGQSLRKLGDRVNEPVGALSAWVRSALTNRATRPPAQERAEMARVEMALWGEDVVDRLLELFDA